MERLRTQLGFEDAKGRYVLLEIAVADYGAVVHRYTGSNIVRFSQIFEGVLNELLEAHSFFYTEPQEGVFLVFLRFSQQDSFQSILSHTQTLAAQIDSSFRHLLDIRSTIIYSLPLPFLREARACYRLMELLRPHAFFRPNNDIYFLQDYPLDASACDAFLAEFEALLTERLASRNLLEIEGCYDDAVRRIVEQRLCTDPTAFARSCERCISAFLADRANTKHALPAGAYYQNYVALKVALLNILRPHCLSNEDQDKNLLIKRALLLIQQHYSEDIGLE